jgi:hypothetical protein
MNISLLKEFLSHVPKSFKLKPFTQKKEVLGGYQLFVIAPPFNDFSFILSHFGKTKFIGNEVVLQDKKAVFGISYSGFYDKELKRVEMDILVAFLNRALIETNKDFPVRGPGEYVEGSYTYYNRLDGDMDQCKGTEWIVKKGNREKLYRMEYSGGIIK